MIRSPRWTSGLLGACAVLLAWEAVALAGLGHGSIPTPVGVLDRLGHDGWSLYWPSIKGTGWEALRGFFWGNLVAVAMAVVVILVPPLERAVTQIAVASYCLPIIAVGPILTIVLNGDSPQVAMAALQVVFTTLIGVLAGLRAADSTSLDLIRAYGGGRWQQLRRVQAAAALPSSFAALKIAAPAAVLGAIIGEFLGGVKTGLGPAMVVSQQALNVERTWGLALVSGAVAGLGYGLVALIARLAMPWAPRSSS
jgi:ABC-type nitrate/sulfonate/bicarbonate transport system permease component